MRSVSRARSRNYNLMWLEDMLTGDYVPWVNPQAYRELTTSTSTPIHTGEQIYLRHNFKELIETQAVRIIGPDPADIGGIAELKWVAEHAHMHSILMAPHGTGERPARPGRADQCLRHPARQLHRLRIPERLRPVVGRHRDRPAQAESVKDSDDRSARGPWSRPRYRRRRRQEVPHGRGPGVLRLIEPRQSRLSA